MKNLTAELIPEKLNIYLQMRKSAAKWREANLIFIHIPKNAGVSLAHAIYGTPMGHWTIQDLSRHHPKLVNTIPTLAVVRNPFERLHSAYTFACQGHGFGIVNGPVVRNHKQYRRPEFATYERFICEWIIQANLSKMDFIFRTQASFAIDTKRNLKPSYIFKLDQIQKIERFLSDYLSRDIHIERMNYTNRQKGYHLTSEMESIIRHVYRDDFKIFYPTI